MARTRRKTWALRRTRPRSSSSPALCRQNHVNSRTGCAGQCLSRFLLPHGVSYDLTINISTHDKRAVSHTGVRAASVLAHSLYHKNKPPLCGKQPSTKQSEREHHPARQCSPVATGKVRLRAGTGRAVGIKTVSKPHLAATCKAAALRGWEEPRVG